MQPNQRDPYLYSYFISYSNFDLPYAKSLSHHLFRQTSRTCWYDESLSVAEHYPTTIFKNIALCQQLIVLVSENALKSDWVVPEVWAALKNDPKNQRQQVIPVSLDDAMLPSPLDQFQTIDARDGITPEVISSIASTNSAMNLV